MENNQQTITKILSEFKALKMSTKRVEDTLGFSNGLLGKVVNGLTNLSEEKFNALLAFYKDNISENTDAIPLEINDSGNASYDSLLKEFHKLIAGAPNSDKVKEKLLALKEKAVDTKKEGGMINWNQMRGVMERCDNYILGVYGKPHSTNKAQPHE